MSLRSETRKEQKLLQALNAQGANIRPYHWAVGCCHKATGYRHFFGYKVGNQEDIHDSLKNAIMAAIRQTLFANPKGKLLILPC